MRSATAAAQRAGACGNQCQRRDTQSRPADAVTELRCRDITHTLSRNQCSYDLGNRNGTRVTYMAETVVIGYTCPDARWTLSGNQCSYNLDYQQTATTKISYSCPADSVSACSPNSQLRQNASSDGSPLCPQGYVASSNRCSKTWNTSQAAVAKYGYQCRSDKHRLSGKTCSYDRKDSVESYTATWTIVAYLCASGWTASGDQCQHRYTEQRDAINLAIKRCDAGWVLNGDQREPISSEVRPAIEERLDTCPNGYLVLGSSCQAYTDHAQGYTGHSHDLDTGLIYMQARYYDPSIGRFLAPDPVGFTETNLTSFNRYAYANNNPYKYVDPDGKSPFDAFRATLSFALADAAIPEPTDVAAPAKAVGYAGALIGTGIVGLAMVGYEALHNEETATEVGSGAAAGESPVIDPKDVAGKTPEEIERLAKEKGLIAKGPDPKAGQGAYIDPVTEEQRVLCHTNCEEPHAHVNNPNGTRLDINGNEVPPESPEAHLPIGFP